MLSVVDMRTMRPCIHLCPICQLRHLPIIRQFPTRTSQSASLFLQSRLAHSGLLLRIGTRTHTTEPWARTSSPLPSAIRVQRQMLHPLPHTICSDQELCQPDAHSHPLLCPQRSRSHQSRIIVFLNKLSGTSKPSQGKTISTATVMKVFMLRPLLDNCDVGLLRSADSTVKWLSQLHLVSAHTRLVNSNDEKRGKQPHSSLRSPRWRATKSHRAFCLLLGVLVLQQTRCRQTYLRKTRSTRGFPTYNFRYALVKSSSTRRRPYTRFKPAHDQRPFLKCLATPKVRSDNGEGRASLTKCVQKLPDISTV